MLRFFELTDKRGGESLRRLPVQPGDLVLVDRGYNDRQAVGRIMDAGADVILRYHSTSFPLLSAAGKTFDLLKRLRALPLGKIGHWPVSFLAGNKRMQARVCALRKTPEQAERTRRKIKAKMRERFEQVKPSTLEYAEFIVVICTVPAGEMSARVALEFYRARWQVELAFKRLKSLLMLGQLPKKKQDSAQAWMQGKILTALLLERLMCEERFFPMGLSTVKICGSGHSLKKCVMRWSVFWPCLCGLMSSESCAEVTAHSVKTARAAEGAACPPCAGPARHDPTTRPGRPCPLDKPNQAALLLRLQLHGYG